MNSLNNSSVDAGAGIIIAGVGREGEVRESRAGAGIIAIDVVLELTDRGVVEFGLEGTELLEQENLWEPLADLIELAPVSLLTML